MKKTILTSLCLITLLFSCKDDDMADPQPPGDNGVDLTSIPYDPTPVSVEAPEGFPPMIIPADNPMTEEGVYLGRMLFYDPILSVDSTVACASCHRQENAFSDVSTLSPGVLGQFSKRNSMPLINVAFVEAGLFWDGRSPNLEDQALHPVMDAAEMGESWDNVEVKLRRLPMYQEQFRKAFGIENSEEITRDLATKAIAQFERTLVSSETRFDEKFIKDNPDPFLFSAEESDGFLLYYDDQNGTLNGGHCAHCHDGGALLSSEKYENNGLQNAPSLEEFPDKGRGNVTGKTTDNGKFRTVSLRNIALTAPYMHDGSIETLRGVVEHYNSGGHYAPNVNAGSINDLGLSEYDIDAIVAFLHTFTDTTLMSHTEWSNPFEQ